MIKKTELKIEQLIIDDNPFKICNSNPNDELIESIKNFGLLNSINVFLINDNHYVIDGFKRLKIINNLKYKTVPCLINSYTNFQDAFSAFTELRFLQNEPTAINKALLYNRLIQIFDNIPNNIRRRINLPSNLKDVELLVKLSEFQPKIQQYLYDISASVKQLRNIIRLGFKNTEILFNKFAIPLKLNANQLSKTIENLADIKIHLNKDPDILITDNFNIDNNENNNALQQKFIKTIEYLRKPNFSEYLNNFNIEKKEIENTGIKIKNNNFEGEFLTFEFKAKNTQDLLKKADIIKSNCSNGKFDKIFEYINL